MQGGSWLNHWTRFGGGAVPKYCPESKCLGKPEVGAHVQKDNSTDGSWYIIPLCNTHNGQTRQALDVSDSITLVPANVSETCGKRSF